MYGPWAFLPGTGFLGRKGAHVKTLLFTYLTQKSPVTRERLPQRCPVCSPGCGLGLSVPW